jgi:hypothetical protein
MGLPRSQAELHAEWKRRELEPMRVFQRLTQLVHRRSAEERQLGLAHTAQHIEVDLHAADPASGRERDCLRTKPLRGENAAAA